MIIKTFALLVLFFSPMAQKWPVNFDNQDSKDYRIRVVSSGGSSSNFTAYRGGTIRGICSDPCRVEVEGIGAVNANNGETVAVKSGQLFKYK
jgi:hypothetical protein